MALIYQGSSNWQQVELPVFGKTAWGLDTATVKWAGPAPDYGDFIGDLNQGSVLTGYPKMYLTSWTGDPHRSFPTASLVYTGLLSGALPDVLIGDEASSSTASQTNDEGEPEDQRTWDIVYYSPIRRYRYITQTRVTSPQYSNWEGGAVGAPSILYSAIRDGNGRYRSGSGGLSWTPAGRLQTISCNPVEGTPFFECEEVWQGIFEPGES